jgi:hypothetical protein
MMSAAWPEGAPRTAYTCAGFLANTKSDEQRERERMDNVTTEEWRQLLRLLLAQRLEINAIESDLKTAGILTDAQIKEIRTQASDTEVRAPAATADYSKLDFVASASDPRIRRRRHCCRAGAEKIPAGKFYVGHDPIISRSSEPDSGVLPVSVAFNYNF